MDLETNYAVACKRHVLGTWMPPIGSIALGLPKGFNRAGYEFKGGDAPAKRNRMLIRLWVKGTQPDWDNCNVPVWAMNGEASEDDDHHGFLFVRTYMPRVDRSCVDVIEDCDVKAVLDLGLGTLDVGTFYDEID
jgi:hypothetical protein